MKTQGVHHITAIVGDPQKNVDFYAGVLGLRMIKKTVNFDDPMTYHLYFGNHEGSPGTAITFFPWMNSPKGRIGGGQVGVTQYAVPLGSLSFWESRLKQKKIEVTKTVNFDEQVLEFEDYDGLKLELIERTSGPLNTWKHGDIDEHVAIKGFAGAKLYSIDVSETVKMLKVVFGYEVVNEEVGVIRLKSEGSLGNTLDVCHVDEKGVMGVGTVHHIALRALNHDDQALTREEIESLGFMVTPFIDRQYFQSIYFREKGRILFEVATDEPGFTVDESIESLGESLKLPPQHEHHRKYLEKNLPKLVKPESVR